jgi:hypothetical protein
MTSSDPFPGEFLDITKIAAGRLADKMADLPL